MPALLVGVGASGARDGAAARNTDDLYQTGKQLFDQFAPPEIKQQYEFPSKAGVRRIPGAGAARLRQRHLEELAAYEPQARAALADPAQAMPD